MTNDVIINGKVVMKDRAILTVDVEKINARTEARAAEVWKNL